jgi:ribose/xylose/arabinose/galactoside ABC-type transport system permease subunit
MSGTARFFRSSLTSVAGPLAALLLAVLVVSLTTDRFMMKQNLSNVSLQVSSVAIAAIGATLVILTGGIDLSPGATVALTSCTLAILAKNTTFRWFCHPLTLCWGSFGFRERLLQHRGRIPSFVVTLATTCHEVWPLITKGQSLGAPILIRFFTMSSCLAAFLRVIPTSSCRVLAQCQAGRRRGGRQPRRRASRGFRSTGPGCWRLCWQG